MNKGKNSGIKYKSTSSFFKKAEDSSRDDVVSPNIEPSQEVRGDGTIGSPNVESSPEARRAEIIASPNVEPSAETIGVQTEIDFIEREALHRGYGKDSALLKHGNSLSHMRAQASTESLGNAKTDVDKAVNPMSLIDMLGAVITVLQNMVKECPNYAISGEANDNLEVLKSFDFIFILHLRNKILGLSQMLCQSLQNKLLDILNAMKYVATTKGLLGDLRNDGFDIHICHVESVCGEFGIPVSNIGDPYRGVLDDGLVTLEHHYRVDMFNGIIDCQLAELNSRFNDGTVKLLQLSGALDPKDNFMLFQADDIYNLAHDLYPSDFTHQEMYCLKVQLQHYSLEYLLMRALRICQLFSIMSWIDTDK
ncbi:hypothetical protein OROGR_028433 [Orobanche gracilis]